MCSQVDVGTGVGVTNLADHSTCGFGLEAGVEMKERREYLYLDSTQSHFCNCRLNAGSHLESL